MIAFPKIHLLKFILNKDNNFFFKIPTLKTCSERMVVRLSYIWSTFEVHLKYIWSCGATIIYSHLLLTIGDPRKHNFNCGDNLATDWTRFHKYIDNQDDETSEEDDDEESDATINYVGLDVSRFFLSLVVDLVYILRVVFFTFYLCHQTTKTRYLIQNHFFFQLFGPINQIYDWKSIF